MWFADAKLYQAVLIYNVASNTAVDHAQTVRSVLEKAGLGQGEKKSATEFGIPVQSRISFLRELLTIHDPTFGELKICEVSNLCCAAFNEGCYVWVHPQEVEDMKDHLTPCQPPMLPPMTPMGNSTSTSIRLTRLLWASCKKSQMKIYCEWEIIHQSRQVAFGKTEEASDSGADIAWSTSPMQLVDVASITILRESTVKVSVLQLNQYAKSLGCVCFRVPRCLIRSVFANLMHGDLIVTATRKSVMAKSNSLAMLAQTGSIRIQSRLRSH